MTKLADNPPAFPFVVPAEWQAVESGMTLRDYFAGQALAGLMLKDPWGNPDHHAAYAYNAADAMLRAREANR